MKLSQWAKRAGISYRTAGQWFKEGKLPGAYQMPSGTILVKEEEVESIERGVAIYARVSSAENKKNLESQAKRLSNYATAKGWRTHHIVKEIGSGVNDGRQKLVRLLKRKDWDVLLVEHKDRLSRFGFNYLWLWLESQGRRI